jgi:ankyrin repeat protein
MLLKHDITDLLLEHGANVNMYEQGQTIAHTAAAANDTLMLLNLNKQQIFVLVTARWPMWFAVHSG